MSKEFRGSFPKDPKAKTKRNGRSKRRNLAPWRAAVLRRDGNRCRLCGYRGQHVSAHHLIFLSHCREEYESDVRNGLALCNGFGNGCHDAVHALKKKIPYRVLPREVVVCLAEQGLEWVPDESNGAVPTGTLARYFE